MRQRLRHWFFTPLNDIDIAFFDLSNSGEILEEVCSYLTGQAV